MKYGKKRRLFPIMLMSAFALFIISVVIVTSVIGRQTGDNGNGDGQSHAPQDNPDHENIIDDYIFVARDGFLRLETGNAEMIHGLVAFDDLIYYIYIDHVENPITQDQAENPEAWESFITQIGIKGIDPSGVITNSITVPVALPHVDIIAFDINNTGEISFISREFGLGNEQEVLRCTRYDFAGNLLLREELMQKGADWFAHSAYFNENGAFAILWGNLQAESTIRFYDENITFIREENIRESTNSSLFALTGQGTFLHLSGGSNPTLRETDIRTGAHIQNHPLTLANAKGIYPAEESSHFDYYIIASTHLYGYVLTTGETEPILDFHESYINLSSRYYITFLADGSIVITQNKLIEEGQPGYVELAVLRPVERTTVEDRDYLILAGFLLRQPFIDEVMDFNRRNPEQQIVVYDYVRDNWGNNPNFGLKQGLERFHLDIIAGNVPDIILFERSYELDMVRARDTLIKQGVLLDLYPFIDSDPDLSRDDFFENVLQGFEDTDGRLNAIGNWLMITTMITTDPVLQSESWRLDDFLTVMEQSVARGNLEPLGGSLTGFDFLSMVLEYMGNTFINFETGICNFDSERFIRLLELAAAIPLNPDYPFSRGINFFPNISELQSGEQVVDFVGFASFSGVSGITGPTGIGPPPFTYIGIPSDNGGIHNVSISGSFSIFANSQYPDAAWQFVRETLLPGATDSIALTLRKDDFENRIAASDISAQDKNSMRELMSQAIVQKPLSGTILMIIEEDFSAFSNGSRTAADTARIIQNRVQTYLYERS
jgi:hypothetical protein